MSISIEFADEKLNVVQIAFARVEKTLCFSEIGLTVVVISRPIFCISVNDFNMFLSQLLSNLGSRGSIKYA